jgi:SAM-dependent methyltransferase
MSHRIILSHNVIADLGSGTGRGVFAALMLHDFKKAVGIEILEGLTDASKEVLTRFNDGHRGKLIGDRKDTDVQFHHGSFLEYDWSDADFVFANSTWYVLHDLNSFSISDNCFVMIH